VTMNLTGIEPSVSAVEPSGAPLGSTRSQGSSSQSSSAQDPASHQVNVNITSTASLLARLEQSLAAQSSVDQGRVDTISKALAGGTYKVQPDRIAHGLLQSERSLAALPLREI
jgi:negative regulator of flagellin synthesis FlgM